MPEHITIRLVKSYLLLVECDGVVAARYDFQSMPDDPTQIIKGIEIVLTSLGYVPDLEGMYTDMDVIILKFNRK